MIWGASIELCEQADLIVAHFILYNARDVCAVAHQSHNCIILSTSTLICLSVEADWASVSDHFVKGMLLCIKEDDITEALKGLFRPSSEYSNLVVIDY